MGRDLSNTKALLKYIGIALLNFSLCRILFLALNTSLFPEFSFWVFFTGLRFDIAAISMVYGPFILWLLPAFAIGSKQWYSTSLKVLFHFSNSLALAFNLTDLIYYRYTLKRSSAEILDFFASGDDFLNLMPRFIIDFWYVFIIWFSLIALSEWLYRKVTIKSISELTIKVFAKNVVVSLIVMCLLVLAGRGGLQHKPLSLIDAGAWVKTSDIPLVLNTPFKIIKTLNKRSLRPVSYFSEEELITHYNPIQEFTSNGGTPLKKNVVIIIMESFSKEYIGRLNDREGETPFFDSLSQHGLLFSHCYANGKKSIEAMPAILSSLPTLMNESYLSSSYSSNRINSLANILADNGYSTSFYHGGNNGTMRFDAFAEIAGIHKYVGRDEYPYEGDFDGNWGIYDEPFFRFFAEEMNITQEPFFSTFFSLSSHHPFLLPEKHKGRFKEGPLPIHKTTRYADYSLGKFFEKASSMPWFANTLFVITADHTSITDDPAYRTNAGVFSIPLLFFAPGDTLKGLEEKTTQQTDILPSILDYLKLDTKILAFGHSVFNSEERGYSINYLDGIYQYIEQNYVLQFDGVKVTAFYDLDKDPLMKTNLVKEESHAVLMNDLEIRLKAIIQQYNTRMINNQLTVE